MDRKLLLASPPAAVISTIFLLIALSVFAVAAPLSESESVTVGNQSQGSAVGSEATAAPAAAAPAAAAGGGGGGGGAGTTTGGGAAATTTPTPSPAPAPAPGITTVPVTSTNVPVTESGKKQEVVQGVTPQDLGVSSIAVDKIDVVQTGVAETTVTASASTIDAIKQAIALDQNVKDELDSIKAEITGQQSQAIAIQTKLEVFQVTSSETGKSAFVSKISLSFTAPDSLQNVKIVQVIPKSVAQSILDVIFSGKQPIVLQADPVVQWFFDSVAKGETRDLSYTVKKKVDSLDATTVAVAAAPQVQPTPAPGAALPGFDNTTVIIIVVVIVVALAAFFVWRRRS